MGELKSGVWMATAYCADDHDQIGGLVLKLENRHARGTDAIPSKRWHQIYPTFNKACPITISLKSPAELKEDIRLTRQRERRLREFLTKILRIPLTAATGWIDQK